MMLIRRDDPVIETFESPDNPPNWIETIDVENQEYQFCDDQGQRYIGKIKKGGFFSHDTFELIPDGLPDRSNLAKMLDSAEMIEAGDRFATLDELRIHLTMPSSQRADARG
jgi:hypothetical protein